jgi:hypothetical protein
VRFYEIVQNLIPFLKAVFGKRKRMWCPDFIPSPRAPLSDRASFTKPSQLAIHLNIDLSVKRQVSDRNLGRSTLELTYPSQSFR